MCHYPEPYLHYFLYHCLIRHSSYRGDEPQAGNGTRIYFKNNGARIAPQTGVCQAGSLDPAKRVTRPRPLTRQDTSTRPQRLAQGDSARRNLGFPSNPTHPWHPWPPIHGSAPVPSRPYDGTRPQSLMTKTTVPPPMPVVSESVATVPLTYLLTRAGKATMFPPSPLTTASGGLTENTVRGSTRPCHDDRQDDAQSP